MVSPKTLTLTACTFSLILGCTNITTDALDLPDIAPSAVSSTSAPSTANTDDSMNDANTTESTTPAEAVPKKEPKLEVAAVPSSISLGQDALTLSAALTLADGSSSDNIGFEVNDESLATIEDGKLTALKAGTVGITVFSLDDPELKQEVFIRITDPAATPAPTPTPTPTPQPTPNLNELSGYFLDYQVGMKWTYVVSFDGALLEALTAEGEDIVLPTSIELSGGLTLENATEEDAEEQIQTLILNNLVMATWDLEVVAVEENSVTIRSSVSSNVESIASQEASEATYTPDTLNLLFGNSPAQQADPNTLTINPGPKNQPLDTGDFLGLLTVDKFSGQLRLPGTQGFVEKVELSLDQERGLIQQIVTTSSEQDTVSVESKLGVRLISFSNGTEETVPTPTPTPVASSAP